MSVNNENPTITSAIFQKFIDKFNLERPCQECGVSSWGIVVDAQELGAEANPMMVATMPDASLNRYAGFYLMQCQNCGYTKTFGMKYVAERVKEIE